MPSANQRQAPSDVEHFADDSLTSGQNSSDEEVAEGLLEEGLADEEDEGVTDSAGAAERPTAPPPAPPGLKEISSLASWTVSSSKPGCGVAALRAPSTNLFWQSDGPQPHHLNIHFFKLVEIVAIRIYLDFDLDESYTPTMVRFAAGTGYNDLQEFSMMKFENPRGWLDVDFEGVGDPADHSSSSDTDMEEAEKENMDRRHMPVLRAMLVQVRICENHQNGKDTHLRGLQIFARDRGVKRGTQGTGKTASVVNTTGMGMKEVGRRKMEEKMWEIPEWAMVSELR